MIVTPFSHLQFLASLPAKVIRQRPMLSIKPITKPLSYTNYEVAQNSSCLDHEHYLCGDEQSVCGRFAQNVLGPVTAVAFANGVKARFGDFKVCAESQGEADVPDFVAVHCTAKNLHALEQLDSSEVPYLKFVGEAKTPWRHDLGKIHHDFTTRKKSTIDRALGQIAKYMYDHKMRYGFLTTYDETIFLKQECFEGSTWGLLISSPIPFDTSANWGTRTVSLRQCLYYLMCVTEEPKNRIANNTTPRHKWISDKSPKDLTQPQLHTPVSQKPQAPTELLQHLSQSPELKTDLSSLTDRIKLHHIPGSGIYSAILQFKHEDIRTEGNRSYVRVGDQWIQAEIITYGQSHRSKDAESSSLGHGFSSSPSPSARLRAQEYGGNTPSKHRKEKVSLMERMQNPKPFQYTDSNYDSGPTLFVDTPTRLPSQPQGHGIPAPSLPHYPVPPAGQYRSSSRDTSGMRGTFHSPYAQFSTEQSPPRDLSQTREMTLPHRPPPFGHHQSLSRDPSMEPGQGGSPDRRAERHDSGSRDKGKGKAKERLDSTGGYNLRSRSDKGESSKGRGKDKDDDEKRGRFPGPFSRKR
ncbi:TPA_exp: Uncharacterized protein A8136_6525 [Trichophyton benhamiae CBS 112371]|nr:TPA_exp: Uncharacterized protein A8136_6525 [Trichophyton benhamiae CBS 112371]